MIFRAFHGEPCPRRASSKSTATCHHAEVPTNPANGEVEDTDVGFPGPDHAIAERALPMRVAMSVLALGAVGAGSSQIPKRRLVIDDFLRPTFADSTLTNRTPNGLLVVRPDPRHVIGLAGIAIAYRIWVARPGTRRDRRARLRPLYQLFVNKWYFDELIDALSCARRRFGRFAQTRSSGCSSTTR
jgi:NADH-quinone oxidoreductase subunit L